MPRAAEGAPADAWYEAQHRTAQWVESFCASGYGPHGGAKVVDGIVSTSPARALLDLGPSGPTLAPYVALARALDDAQGDAATGGLLLAAALVRHGSDAVARGLPRARLVEGLRLARRQALAMLDALARPDPDGRSLVPVAGPALAEAALALLENAHPPQDPIGPMRPIAPTAPLDLDAVDVVVDPQGPAWHEGVLARVEGQPHARSGNVLIVGRGPRLKTDGLVLRKADLVPEVLAWQEHQVGSWCRKVVQQGVVLVVSPGTLGGDGGDEGGVAARLRSRGILVWEDAPKDALQRLAVATGATAGATLEEAKPGRCTLHARPRPRRGWWVSGEGPGWTLLVPPHPISSAASPVDEGRRLLRAAGAWSQDPRCLPGAGAWQHEVRASLRRMAPLTPGKAPLGVAVAAAAFETLLFGLATNQGADRLSWQPPTHDVVDGYAATRHAVAAAFETAIGQLRIDAAYAKPPSTTRSLRGSAAAPGSPLGMPGDIPPLM